MFGISNIWLFNVKNLYRCRYIYTNINLSVWSSAGEPYGKEDGSKKDAWKNPKTQNQHEENNNIKVLEAAEM